MGSPASSCLKSRRAHVPSYTLRAARFALLADNHSESVPLSTASSVSGAGGWDSPLSVEAESEEVNYPRPRVG